MKLSIAERLNTIPETNPDSINLNIDEEWVNLRAFTHQAAVDSLGYAQRRHRDWFDENSEEISMLLAVKNKAHDALLSNPLSAALRANWRSLRSETQRKLREMENGWWQARAEEIQGFADRHDSHGFYNAIKAIHGPSKRNITPVRSDHGVLLKENQQILNR